jgi:hypothetical protein
MQKSEKSEVALALNCYLPGKMILIDASGWSDLLLGVVVGAIKPPHPMLMERRIPTAYFQLPNFQTKKYLEYSKKIADEIVTVMQPDDETCFKICSEYVLSAIASHLQSKGFKVQKIESTGELKQLVDDAYVRWCVASGVPRELLKEKRRFWAFLDWVAQNPHVREGLVKTGWASWESKWRTEIYNRHNAQFHPEKF